MNPALNSPKNPVGDNRVMGGAPQPELIALPVKKLKKKFFKKRF
jgi:hypothetical protein